MVLEAGCGRLVASLKDLPLQLGCGLVALEASQELGGDLHAVSTDRVHHPLSAYILVDSDYYVQLLRCV
jgi:hypothetical protein